MALKHMDLVIHWNKSVFLYKIYCESIPFQVGCMTYWLLWSQFEGIGGASISADLGESSKYSSKILENLRGEGFHDNRS